MKTQADKALVRTGVVAFWVSLLMSAYMQRRTRTLTFIYQQNEHILL